MRLFSLFRFLSVVCITLLVSGASPAPLEELRLYAEAFQETRAAGHILLDRVAPIIAAVQVPNRVDESNAAPPVNDCSVDRHGAPRCFDARLAIAEARSSEPAPIAVRRAALELISTYNGILIELASGRQPQELQSRLGEVVELAGTILVLTGGAAGLAPLVPPVAAGLNKLTEQLGAARAAAISRQEILDNRDTVKALLVQLQDDIPKLYEIYRLKRLDDRRQALNAKNNDLAEAASSDIRQFHTSLAAYFVLIGRTSETLETLASAAGEPGAPNLQRVSRFFRSAFDLRRDAKTFWESIRRVGETRR
jgi:hypothetical protein